MLTALTNFTANYTYNSPTLTTNSSSASTAVNAVVFLVGAVFVLAILVLSIVGIWKVFVKAGRPGWAAIVPLYNSWVLAEVAGKPGWWGLYPLVVWIPVIGWIGGLIVSLMLAIGVAEKFGKDTVFGVVGLWLFSFVGFLILGLGDAKYQGSGPAGTPSPAGDPPYPPRPPVPPTPGAGLPPAAPGAGTPPTSPANPVQ